MRIGMLLDVYSPHVSGVTLYVKTTKAALESRGHDVHVFTFGDLQFVDKEPNIHRSSGLQLGQRLDGYRDAFQYSFHND